MKQRWGWASFILICLSTYIMLHILANTAEWFGR